MASHRARVTGALSDYANIRTIPAVLSVGFVMASLYQFGGISGISLPWFEYTLTAEHATLISLFAFAVAFVNSETHQFEYYENWRGFFTPLFGSHSVNRVSVDSLAMRGHTHGESHSEPLMRRPP